MSARCLEQVAEAVKDSGDGGGMAFGGYTVHGI